MIKIAAENLVDLGRWLVSRDTVANRLGPSITKSKKAKGRIKKLIKSDE